MMLFLGEIAELYNGGIPITASVQPDKLKGW